MNFVSLPTPHSRWCSVDAGYGGGADANSNSQDQSFGGGESYNSGYSGSGQASTSAARAANNARAASNAAANRIIAERAQAAARAEQARLAAIAAEAERQRAEAARKVAENKTRSQARLAEPANKQGLLSATKSITNLKNFDPLAYQVSPPEEPEYIPSALTLDPSKTKAPDVGVRTYENRDDINRTAVVDNKATPEQKADALNNSMNVAAGHTAKERNESVGYATFGQEMDRIGIINTFFNHTPGLLPGVAVQAKVDFDPNDAKGNIGDYERAGNDYSFNGMEAIGDVLGLGTGIPGVGTLLGNLDNKYTKFGLGSTDKALVDKIGIDGSLKVADNKIKGAKDAADDAVDFVKEDVVDFVKNGLSQLNNPNGLYNPTGYNPDGEGQQNIEIKKSISDFFNIETNPAKITEKTNPAEVTEKTNETPTTDNGLLGRSNFNRIQSQESRLSPSDRFSSGYYAR